jgi:hypothetical protein
MPAHKQAAATLRANAVGSQDESPSRAIHKFNCNGWRSEDRRYNCNLKGKAPAKRRRYLIEQLFDFRFDFGLLEGLALDFAVAFGIH